MEPQDLRMEIDRVDTQLTDLFCRRMELCAQVAEHKKGQGKMILDRAREREILARVGRQAGEELDLYARMLYGVLLDLSKAYQRSFYHNESQLSQKIRQAAAENRPFPRRGTVACQGVEGAYSQIACDKLFPMPDITYFPEFEGVFQAVEQGRCDFGILPIENSSNGSVNRVYDLMHRYQFHIVRSIRLHIDHNLLTKPGVQFSDIREIYSHEQALGQCRDFLNQHPHIKIIPCENTAVAAKLVAESDRRDIAALSSRNCAELYGLQVLSHRIQNSENNYTRFICIAKDLTIYPGADRISLMLSVEHTPGALYQMITKFSTLGLNLTKLESRPIPGRDFEFLFYFDLEASVWSEDVIHLLGDCSTREQQMFVFLGSYSEVR